MCNKKPPPRPCSFSTVNVGAISEPKWGEDFHIKGDVEKMFEPNLLEYKDI